MVREKIIVASLGVFSGPIIFASFSKILGTFPSSGLLHENNIGGIVA